MNESFEITPQQLQKEMQPGSDPALSIQLVDVREETEFRIANIGGILIPLGELTLRHEELDASRPTVVLCHHGVRSRYAVEYLKSVGFKQIRNLVGGIDRWSVQIDPLVPRY